MGIDSSPGKEPILSRTELVFVGHQASIANALHPDRNEDSSFVDMRNLVAGVFDGAGGHLGGEIASKLAAEKVKNGIIALPQIMTREEAVTKVGGLLVDADQSVAIKAGDAERGMRTTGVLVCFYDDRITGNKMAAIANVGDSRVYLWRNGELRQVTVDDHNPSDRKNIVSQLLGEGDAVPRVYVVDVKKGDRFILCSDGVSDNLTEEEIAKLLATSGVGTAAFLVKEASIRSTQHTTRSKRDDMTAIVIDVDERSRQQEKPPEAKPERWALNQEVVVKRTSGDFELWKVVGRDERGRVVVANEEGSQKRINEPDLIALNSTDFGRQLNQLFKDIEAGGEVAGSRGTYSPKYLQEIISDVLNGTDKLTTVTREFRKRVEELLKLREAIK